MRDGEGAEVSNSETVGVCSDISLSLTKNRSRVLLELRSSIEITDSLRISLPDPNPTQPNPTQ